MGLPSAFQLSEIGTALPEPYDYLWTYKNRQPNRANHKTQTRANHETNLFIISHGVQFIQFVLLDYNKHVILQTFNILTHCVLGVIIDLCQHRET